MQRPSQAACRFYTAFYSWNILTSASSTHHAHPHHLASLQRRGGQWQTLRHVSARPLQQRRASRDRGSGKGDPSVQIQKLDLSKQYAPAQPPPSKSWKERLQQAQVQPSSDKPFDTLQPWEDVVRYRSSVGIMVQTSVPVKRVKELERVYGEGLKGMGEKLFGTGPGAARIELGTNVIEKEMLGRKPETVRSMLYSGTLEEAEKVRLEIGSLGEERRGSAETLEGFTRGKRGKDLVRATATKKIDRGNMRMIDNERSADAQVKVNRYTAAGERPGVDYDTALRQSSTQPTPFDSATLPHSTTNRPNWLLKPSTPTSTHPTRSLRPFNLVLRSWARSTDQVHISTIIPSVAWSTSLWHDFVAEPNRTTIGAEMSLGGGFFQRDAETGRNFNARVRDVEIRGSVEQVQQIRDAIIEVQRRLNAGRVNKQQVEEGRAWGGKRGSGGGSTGGEQEGDAQGSSKAPSSSSSPVSTSRQASTNPQLLQPVKDSYTPLPSWLLKPPKSRTEHPSSNLVPLQPTLRDRSQGNQTLHVEIVIPANERWDLELMELMRQPKDDSLSLDIEAPFSKMDENTGESHWRRPLMLKGVKMEILGMVEAVERMKKRILGLVKVSEDTAVPNRLVDASAESVSEARDHDQHQVVEDEEAVMDDTNTFLDFEAGAMRDARLYEQAMVDEEATMDDTITSFDLDASSRREDRKVEQVVEGKEQADNGISDFNFAANESAPSSTAKLSAPSQSSMAERDLQFYARVAIPDLAAAQVRSKITDMLGSGVFQGSEVSVQEKSGPQTSSTGVNASAIDDSVATDDETVLLIRASEPKLLHEITGRAAQWATQAVEAPSQLPSSSDHELGRIGRILDMGTRNASGVDVPDPLAAWYGTMPRHALDRFSLSRRLTIPAFKVGGVIALLPSDEKTVGLRNCRIEAERDSEVKGKERYVRIWAKDRESLGEAKRRVVRTVRRMARKNGVVGWESWMVRAVDEEGRDVDSDVRTVRDGGAGEDVSGKRKIVEDRDVGNAFDEAVRTPMTALDAGQESAGVEMEDGSEDARNRKMLSSRVQVMVPARYADHVLAKMPPNPDGVITTEHSSEAPDQTIFNILAGNKTAAITLRNTIADFARERFVEEGAKPGEVRLRRTSAEAAESWIVMEVMSENASKAELAPSRIVPLYRKIAIPQPVAGYVLTAKGPRVEDIVGCFIFRSPSESLTGNEGDTRERRDEVYLILWGSTQKALDEGVDLVRDLVAKAWATGGVTDVRVNPDVRFVGEGADEDGYERMRAEYLYSKPIERQPRFNRFNAYSTFTLPEVILQDVDASLSEMVRTTKCQLRRASPPEVLMQDLKVDSERRIYTLWGRTEEHVERARNMLEQTTRESLEARGADDVALSVVQEGVSEVTLGKVMEAVTKEPSRSEHSAVDHINGDARFLPTGSNALSDASEMHTYFESAEDFEGTGQDDMIFPEFNPPFADDISLRKAPRSNSLSFALPAIGANARTVKRPLQQRAYSTTVYRSLFGATATQNSEEKAHEATTDAQRGQEKSHEPTTDAQQGEVKSKVSNEELVDNIKRTLQTFTHPVVVITSRLAKRASKAGRLEISRGVTVSSFNTVTLSPTPVISLNLRVPSRSWDAICDSGAFAVHILSATPEGAAVAHAFTQPYDQPGEPFRRLEKLGVHIYVNNTDPEYGFLPPQLAWGSAVMARISASLLPDKCVHVGDHVIVVGQVKKIHFLTPEKAGSRRVVDEQVALAYAKRGYRSIGDGVSPVDLPELPKREEREEHLNERERYLNEMEERLKAREKLPHEVHQPLTNDNRTSGSDTIRDNDAGSLGEEEGQGQATDQATKLTQHDESVITQREANDGLESDALTSDEVDPQAQNSFSEEAVRTGPFETYFEAAESDENKEDTVPLSTEAATPEEPRPTPFESYFEQLESNKVKDDSAPRSMKGATQHTYNYSNPPAVPQVGPKRGSQSPWGISRDPKSSYSTSTIRETGRRGTFRSYSTSPALLVDTGKTRKSNRIDQVSDPEILSASVADFLGVPEDQNESAPIYRIRGLIRLQREARNASHRLERALADGSLTPEESARLENIVTRNERRVAKVLALRSAKDLRRILDKGTVNYSQVQWLETNIEKGQAVLLEEARQLRRMLDDKTIVEEQFRMVKEKLTLQNQTLTAEATRLRQMIDEESEGGGAVGRDFDGFRGNL